MGKPKMGTSMKKIHALLSLFAIFSIVLPACGVLPKPTPSATPSPSNTPLPTATFTPVPTSTPKPTNTPTPEPAVELGELQSIAEGGFSFRPPAGYEVDIQGAQIGVFEPARTIIISFFGATKNPKNQSADEILDEFTEAVFRKGDGEFTKENLHTIQVDGVEGIAYDIIGTMFATPFRGQAISVMPSKDQYLFGLALANTIRDKKRWENEGHNVFNSLLESIQFSTSEQSQAWNGCTIATDNTYGFTEENPIRVGGDFMDGPARERAYLDNLLGPNGETVSYERNGSILSGDVILDAYEITVAGKRLTLYIDMYGFTEPQAPVGFTCIDDFPFSEP